jgi:hypothetical protein
MTPSLSNCAKAKGRRFAGPLAKPCGSSTAVEPYPLPGGLRAKLETGRECKSTYLHNRMALRSNPENSPLLVMGLSQMSMAARKRDRGPGTVTYRAARNARIAMPIAKSAFAQTSAAVRWNGDRSARRVGL